MSSKIISGKDIASKRENVLKEKVSMLSQKIKIVSILVGDDPSSIKYTEMKQKKAAEVGIDFEYIRFPETELFQNVVMTIIKLNNEPTVTGIMVQLPLPDSFLKKNQKSSLLKNISRQKDIDGLTENSPFLPATVRGVMSILNFLKINQDFLFAVIGASGVIGKSLVKELKKQKFLVTEIDIKNPESKFENIKKADVVISCVGQENLIKSADIKSGSILIDVGLGDFDESCFEKASFYTPKIGGVGPMTVISLLENAVDIVS